MDITYVFPMHGVEADVRAETKNGVTVVTVSPYYHRPDAKPNVAYVTTKVKGKTINQEVQQLAGATGKLDRVDRLRKVKPRIESITLEDEAEEETGGKP